MSDVVNEAGEPVEIFGSLELVLSECNSTGYKDVFFLKNRKNKPYQAKICIWRPETKDHINLGTFRGAHEAAIAVALYRRDGREDQPSPDKSRAEKSTRSPPRPGPTFTNPFANSLVASFGSRVHREAKVGCRDDHRCSGASYFPRHRELSSAIAGRAVAAVVRVLERSCVRHRRCGRCAACAAAFSPGIDANAPRSATRNAVGGLVVTRPHLAHACTLSARCETHVRRAGSDRWAVMCGCG